MSFQLLKTVNFATNGDIRENLDTVRGRSGKDVNYLRGILCRISLSLASASTSDAIVQNRWAGILPQLQFLDQNDQPYFDRDMPATALHELVQWMARRGPVQPAALGTNTNATNLAQISVYAPFYVPRLCEPWSFLEPSAMLKTIVAKWAANSIWGTGQVINTATTMQIYAHHLPMKKLEIGPRLYLGRTGISSFTEQRLDLRGRLLALGVCDTRGAAATNIGATDFTHAEVEGNDVKIVREDVDVPSLLYNTADGACGDASDAALPLPTSGTAYSFPLHVHPIGAKVADLAHEGQPAVRLIVGAGAPALTDQDYIYAVARPITEDRFATGIGKAKDIAVDEQQVRQMLAATGGPQGRKGQLDPSHPMAPYLRRPVVITAP